MSDQAEPQLEGQQTIDEATDDVTADPLEGNTFIVSRVYRAPGTTEDRYSVDSGRVRGQEAHAFIDGYDPHL